MAVKVLIKRMVPRNKALDMIPLFSEMRTLAMNQEGYISGETLRNLDDPDEFLVISIWNSSNDWKNWLKKKERKEIQAKMDTLLGKETEYKVFHHGLTE
jgi:heme-degrading monooxygenase HmoA